MNKDFFKELINKNHKKFIFIGEISTNHRGSFFLAKKLINSAKKSGCDFVKFQTYENFSMTINSKNNRFKIQSGLWKGYNLWDLYSKAQTPFKWQRDLFQYSRKSKIKCFSSPFDKKGLKILESLKCPIYKIASIENTDFSLLKDIAKTKKPVIMSTGTANIKEIEKSFYFLKKNGCKHIALLYCVTNYPAKIEDFNLNNIKLLKKKFKCTVGFSDHSNNPDIVKGAIASGAEIIEKHIDIKTNKKSLDKDFSIQENDLKKLINNLTSIKKLFLNEKYFLSKGDIKSRKFRRSIYVIKKIMKNEKFNYHNLKCLRPYNGLGTINFEKIIAMKSPQNFKYGTPINSNIFKKILIHNKKKIYNYE